MRVSIFITCTLELVWRTFTGSVTLPRTTTFYKALLTFIPVVCLTAASVLDLTCVCRYITRAYRHHTTTASATDGATESFVINSYVFAFSILASALMRFLFVRSLQAPRHEKVDYNMTATRHVMTIVYAIMMLSFWPSSLPTLVQESVVTNLQERLLTLGFTGMSMYFVCGIFLCLMVSSLSKLVSTTTCHFASQSYCIWMVFVLWVCAPPVGWARWICFSLFLVAIKSLSFEADVTLEKFGADAPNWVYQAKQIENVIRHNISLTLHSFVTMPLNGLNSFIAPKSQVRSLQRLKIY
jgi:hypothetical protein